MEQQAKLTEVKNNMHKSPLFLDGWLEFNRVKWGLQPLRVNYSPDGAELPMVEAVYYLNKAGRVVQPKLNPYFPIAFTPTPTQALSRVYRQWLSVATPLVEDIRQRGLRSTLRLLPEITDARPWRWAGFHVSVRYTFYNEFPFDIQMIDPAVRRKIKQAQRANYSCQRSQNMAHALACLEDTQQRQGFHDRLQVRDFELLRDCLGDEHFRVYICYAENGEPASTRVLLHCPGGRAIDWLVGTRTNHLSLGATQLLLHYVIEDLQTVGASGFDFEGANIPSVAATKMIWGGKLVPLYSIDPFTLRSLARWALYRFQNTKRTEKKVARDAESQHEQVTAVS